MILITNGGAHPPEKWAVATAEIIFPTDNVRDSNRLLQAKKLQFAIADALVPHHTDVQTAEKGKLATLGDAHLDTPHDPLEAAQKALADIVALAKGTPWELHFADAAVQAEIVQEIGNHFATAEHIERQWHCHRSGTPAAKAFLKQHAPVAA